MGCGSNVRELRVMKGLKAKFVASKIGVSPSMYCDMEKERRRIDASILAKIADVFGVSADELLRPRVRETRIEMMAKKQLDHPCSGAC
ncbi:helix-turn-helix domain-containing protein [Heliobacterium undosum]|uniref:Helix-turn-helix domain-containing protein n=1 Tax=Heliomicrobium undosum TaxID=121734 RepID=A0A845L6B9_9FIRM|nr:helix-turn-helix transcriptional regulator [Heliomicrobium undosum]MZP30789.1 helix-turn-helix domain-containing protein [Heliomicrobium undosum]